MFFFFFPSTLSFLVFLFSISLNCCFYMFCTLLTGSLIATSVWFSFDAIGDMRWRKKYVIFLAVVFLHKTISFSDQKTSNQTENVPWNKWCCSHKTFAYVHKCACFFSLPHFSFKYRFLFRSFSMTCTTLLAKAR